MKEKMVYGILSESLSLSFLMMGFLLLLSVAQASTIHYYDFILKETNIARLCSSKSMMTVNGSFPGPVIRVHKGDTVYVNVHNHGNYGVTIHWHGVKQPRNPWSDGPEFITQCPIEPGSNFTYEVIFTKEEGTLWWHAHSDWTRAGVHGAIVILPKEGTTYPFEKPDGEEVIVLASWYKVDVNRAVQDALDDGTTFPLSDAYTINGQPGDFCECSKGHTYRWMVDYGRTYLIRLVNAVMNVEMFFAIGHHNLTVVAMDGSYIKPIITSYVMISPGQTMDILITTNQSLGQYYIAARQYDTIRADVADFDKVNATAILQYGGNSSSKVSPIFPNTLPVYADDVSAIRFVNQIRSLANDAYPIDVPKNITTRMYVTASVNYVDFESNTTRSGLASSLNNVSWVNPLTDVLMAYYRNLSGFYTTDFPDWPPEFFDFVGNVSHDLALALQGTEVKVLNYNEEVEMVFQGTNVLDGAEDHPMHLHGYAFYVVGSGYGNFNNETDPKSYNLVDPPELNTVSLPRQGWVAIRFRASNPGVWLWHCHYERHYSWGMNMVLIVKNGGTPLTSIKKPPPYMPPCKASALQLSNANTSSFI